MKKILMGLLIGLILGAGATLIYYQNNNWTEPTPAPQATTKGEKVAQVSIQSALAEIVIDQPFENQEVGLSFLLAGKASVAENLVRYRIKDSSGKIFLADQTKALVPPNANPHTFGPFAQIITLPQALANQNGTLEIFSDNLGATEEINKIMIPLKFR